MDERIRDDSLNLDSSGTIELGRNPAAQAPSPPPECSQVPEPRRNVRCDTQHRELLGHAFGTE